MKLEQSALYSKLFAVVIAATAYAFALSGGNFAVLVPFQATVLLVPGLGLLTPSFRSFDSRNLFRWLTISIVVLLSVLLNAGKYPTESTTIEFAAIHAVGIVGTLFSLQWAATNLSPEEILRNVAILLFPLVVLAVVVALRGEGWLVRASPLEVHPNWWGELGFAATASALAVRSRMVRALLLCCALILFLLVQSRGALVAAVVSITTYILLSLRYKRMSRTWLLGGLSLLAIAVVGFALGHNAVLRGWQFFSDAVLLLGDPYRGLDTGLTGRLVGWRDAIGIAADNPIVGSGLDTLYKVHNGFLQLVGEGGVPLLLVIVGTMAFAILDALKRGNHVAVGLIFGYAAYAMTYPRMLNMNVASILFYLSLFAWRRPLTSRRAEQRRVTRPSMMWAANGIGDTHAPSKQA